jgi:alpha-tubulin suppressor-like RCC1 family protein
VEILKDAHVRLIGCGGNHSVAIIGDGEVWWGSNKYGQAGMPFEQALMQFPQHVWSLDGERIASLKCGDYHNLALTESGSVFAWGRGSEGQLGSSLGGDEPNCFKPIRIHFLDVGNTLFTRIAAGGGLGCSYSMALNSEGTLFWFSFISFSLVLFCSVLVFFSVDPVVSCAGDLYGWGSGKCGQLGQPVADVILPRKIDISRPTANAKSDNTNPNASTRRTGNEPITDFACGWLHTIILVGETPRNLTNTHFGGEHILNPKNAIVGNFFLIPNDILRHILWFMTANALGRIGICSSFWNSFICDQTLWMCRYSR